jgi:DNA-binding response OmpR family regulator
VWGYPPGTAELSLVRWHIKNLREKIETDPQNPLYLRTIPRRGYVFDPVQPPAAT